MATSTYYELYPDQPSQIWSSLDWAELSFLIPPQMATSSLAKIPTSLGSCWRADLLPAFPFQPEEPVAVQVSGTDAGLLGTFLGSLWW